MASIPYALTAITLICALTSFGQSNAPDKLLGTKDGVYNLFDLSEVVAAEPNQLPDAPARDDYVLFAEDGSVSWERVVNFFEAALAEELTNESPVAQELLRIKSVSSSLISLETITSADVIKGGLPDTTGNANKLLGLDGDLNFEWVSPPSGSIDEFARTEINAIQKITADLKLKVLPDWSDTNTRQGGVAHLDRVPTLENAKALLDSAFKSPTDDTVASQFVVARIVALQKSTLYRLVYKDADDGSHAEVLLNTLTYLGRDTSGNWDLYADQAHRVGSAVSSITLQISDNSSLLAHTEFDGDLPSGSVELEELEDDVTDRLLPKTLGTDGQVLTVDSGAAVWEDAPGGGGGGGKTWTLKARTNNCSTTICRFSSTEEAKLIAAWNDTTNSEMLFINQDDAPTYQVQARYSITTRLSGRNSIRMVQLVKATSQCTLTRSITAWIRNATDDPSSFIADGQCFISNKPSFIYFK